MKTVNKYPDWVEAYRGKGKTIRKVRNGYGLYKCTSVYVKGSKNPKSKQEYLGMITEKDGFIPKTVVSSSPIFLEYGLSNFIVSNYWRDLKRNVYQSSDELIYLGIVYFVFGGCNDFFIHSCCLTVDQSDDLIAYRNKINTKRIVTVSKTISKFLDSTVPDKDDQLLLLSGLKLCVVEKGTKRLPALPNELQEIINRNGLKPWKKD